MANNLSFTSNINGKNITGARIVRARYDDDAAEAIIDIELSGPGGVIWPLLFPIVVRNGFADALVSQTNPATHLDIVKMERLGGAGLATAFDQVRTADRAAGNSRTNVLNVLRVLVGDRVAGASPATATLLPAGTVS